MNKDKKSVLNRIRERIKPENRVFVEKNMSISRQVSDILEKRGMTQKDLAQLLGKQESEVSKWLSGLHNLTLQSLTKIEAGLGEEIITTPLEACNKYQRIKYVTLKVFATTNNSFKYMDYEYDEKVSFDAVPKPEIPAA